MKIIDLLSFLLLMSFLLGCSDDKSPVEEEKITEEYVPDRSEIPAFPGAEGGGMYITGGAAGEVYTVDRLDDTYDTGTLRWALDKSGPRTIVFAVGGVIELSRELKISNGDLTIAGQTAPGDGITIKNYSLRVDADNVIIRFMRFRMGDEAAAESDAIWGRNHKNIIIDHCSISWSTDECASFYDNENFTMQWCIVAESLNESVHDKGAHGYGGLWGGYNATFHHNLLAHHKSRNPRFYGLRDGITRERAEMVNNVIYNWGENSSYGGEGGEYNIVSNYYKAGPGTVKHPDRIFEPYKETVYGRFYVSGNYVDGYADVTNNNVLGIDLNAGGSVDDVIAESRFDIIQVSPETAEEAYQNVMSHAGMSLTRDAVDLRIVNEVQSGTATYGGVWGDAMGIIDTQSTVGGWPAYASGEAAVDSDGDGMSDDFELKNDLDAQDASDGKKYTLSESYTNLEIYLNSLVTDKIAFGATE